MKRRQWAVSREGRDTLWLLAMLAMIMAPHVSRLPLWCAVGATLAMLWRAHVAWHDGRLPPRWALFVALVAAVGLTVLTHKALFGREAGVTLVVVLTGLKTLELRARRDAFVVTSLGFFLILTQFLYSQSLLLAVLMLVAVWGLMTSLVLAQRPLGRPPLAAVAREAGRTLLWGMPLMVVLFLLFPRIGPLWALPSDSQARTGLSDTMRLGNVAELALDDSIAMRLRFDGPVPGPADLYFRGPVLDEFDGRTWRPRPQQSSAGTDEPAVKTQGRGTRYQLTLEPTHGKVVPLLEATVTAQAPPQQTTVKLRNRGMDWLADRPLHERIQLDAEAFTRFLHGPRQATPDLSEWTRLPPGFNPRTHIWAARFKSESGLQQAGPSNLALAVLQYIRREKFSYTLSPGEDELDTPERPSPHQIDRFWLDRRAGFCEHFASAFVVVMREMGVPARVVTGFQGAERNPVDGLYMVRNSDAHAWAEFWQPGEGWVRADPTAAVAPERVERGRILANRGGFLPGPLAQIDSPMWRQGRAFWEATNHRWNVWVLQYSKGSQRNLLGKLGWDANDWTDVARALTIALSGIAIGGLVWLWFTRERTPSSPWLGPMWRVHRALTKAGMPAPDHCPAPASALNWIAILKALPTAEDDKAGHQAIITLTEALHALDAMRYGPPSDPHGPGHAQREQLARAKRLVRAIEDGARQWRRARAPSGHGAH